jgi:transposase
LLTAIYDASSPQWLRDVPALDILRRVWLQNYLWDDAHLIWRASDNIPPATQFISSPYDL